MNHPAEVDRQERLPVLERQIADLADLAQAGVVDQELAGPDLGQDAREGGGVRHVQGSGHDAGLGVDRQDLRPRRFSHFQRAIAEHERDPFGRDGEAQGSADPAAAAGHQGSGRTTAAPPHESQP